MTIVSKSAVTALAAICLISTSFAEEPKKSCEGVIGDDPARMYDFKLGD